MARVKMLTVDVTDVIGSTDELARAGEGLGAAVVDAINDTAEGAYRLASGSILDGVNLSETYLRRNLALERATEKNPVAEIVAPTGRAFVANLSHYTSAPGQVTAPVTWTDARIGERMGQIGPGGFPWTSRKGDAARGIPAGRKQAGRSVQVRRGNQRVIGPAFTLPGKPKDGDGNPILFHRVRGARRRIEALYGPSVYQLFNVTKEAIAGQVEEDLAERVASAAEEFLERALA